MFELKKTEGKARRGEFTCAHGTVQTPVFMNVGTQAAIKGALSAEDLERIGYQGYLLKSAPEKVLQFGEGNFLRAFVNCWFDLANERVGWNGKCAIIKPRSSASDVWKKLNAQEGLYTLYLRGM